MSGWLMGKGVLAHPRLPGWFCPRGAVHWGLALVSVGLATGGTLLLREAFRSAPNALFFCAVIFSAWLGGLGPGILAAVLSVLAIKYSSTPPLHTLAFSFHELPRLLVFLASGVFISWVSGRQQQAEAALRRGREELERKVQARTLELQTANRALQAGLAERQRADAELRRIQTYLSEGQRLSHTGSWAWNVKRRENVFWSKEHFRIYGLEPEASNGDYQTARQRLHPEDGPLFDQRLEQAIREKNDFDFYHRLILPDGEVKHIHTLGHPVLNDSGELVEFIGTAMDVTERTLAEALLSAEKQALEMIASGAPLPAVLQNLCTAFDEQTPGAFSSVLALDPDGQKLWPLAGPHLPEAWTRTITPLAIGPGAGSCGTAAFRKQPVVVSDIATDPLWTQFRDAALSHHLHACWSSPVLSTEGQVLGTFAMYFGQPRRPVPRELELIDRATRIAQIAMERERTQESLRTTQANLARVTRITTMGELAASIAHEVNQPLTAVINNANASLSLLESPAENLGEVRAALADIVQDAERASAVVERVRALARKAPLHRAPLELQTIVADVLALTRQEAAARGVTLRTELPENLPPVSADRVQLEQVLLNLVVNGMDAMAEVEARQRVLLIRGRPDSLEGRPAAILSVHDSGSGLKPGTTEQLFEAFYTTKPQGLGLGLAISRSIIEAHGGRLWAEKNDSAGATFAFSLPALRETSP